MFFASFQTFLTDHDVIGFCFLQGNGPLKGPNALCEVGCFSHFGSTRVAFPWAAFARTQDPTKGPNALCEVGFFSHNVGPCVMIMMSVGPFVKRNELLKGFNVLYSVRLDVFRNF